MYSLILCVHVFLCVFLVTLVLLQQGKGADMGAVMGSGGANSLFGVSGASNVLTRMTTISAILFMFTSLMLVRFSSGKNFVGAATTQNELSGSVMDGSVEENIPPAAPPSEAAAAAAGTPTVAAPAPVAAAQPIPEITGAAVSTPAQSSDKK